MECRPKPHVTLSSNKLAAAAAINSVQWDELIFSPQPVRLHELNISHVCGSSPAHIAIGRSRFMSSSWRTDFHLLSRIGARASAPLI